MSSFFDDLEAQLRTAAHARVSHADAAGPRRRRTWAGWRAGVRAVPALASLAIVVLIAGGALLLTAPGTGHRVRQTPGTLASILRTTSAPQLRREFGYIRAATKNVLASPVCQTKMPSKLTFIAGRPSPGLLATLGVLRRPGGSADRPGVARALAGSPEQVYRDYVRLSLVSNGLSYYIVAVREIRSAVVPSVRCFGRQESALRAYAPGIPASIRTDTIAIQSGMIAYERHLVASEPRDGICTLTLDHHHNDTGSSCATPANMIRAGQLPSDDNGTFTGVVPDGVASVTLQFPAVGRRQAVVVEAPVYSNVYATPAPPQFSGATGSPQPTMIWRSGAGRVIKTITPPRPGEAAKYCRAHPIPCVLLSVGATTESSSSSSSSASATATTPKSPSAH